MKISRYFRDLRSAYEAELDDLTSDSEGKDVLRRRLAEKRKEFGFLLQMVEVAPEMVAVVFHRGFRFAKPAPLQALVACNEDSVPDWHSLGQAVTLDPAVAGLADTVLAAPGGARFLAVAAGLEYLLHHAHDATAAQGSAQDGDEDDDTAEGADFDDDGDALSADDARDPQTSRSRDEASDNWLSDVGFERKGD